MARKRTITSVEKRREKAVQVFNPHPTFFNPKVKEPYEPHKGVIKIIEEGALGRSREFLEAFNNSVNRYTGFVVS